MSIGLSKTASTWLNVGSSASRSQPVISPIQIEDESSLALRTISDPSIPGRRKSVKRIGNGSQDSSMRSAEAPSEASTISNPCN